MELLTAPPVEIAAIAEPSARGAAPLLDPAGAGSRGPPPAVPFDLLLGLLKEPLPGGEAWPAGGKKLPLPRLDTASETATPTAWFPSTAPAMSHAAEAFGRIGPSPMASAGAGVPALPAAADPPAAIRPTPLLPPLLGPEQTRAANAAEQPFPAELAWPAELVPTGPEIFDAAPRPALDSASAPEAEPEALDHSFSTGARLRAQLASAVEPRAGASSAASPAAPTNVPPALLEAYPPSAREKLPPQPGAARGLDALAAFTASAAAGEAPVGVAGDWLLAGHTHVHGTSGTAGTAAAPPAAPPLPNAPIDARLPDWQEAFAQRAQWLVDTDAGEARIKLNPPELGAVDVKISLVDDKTHVHLTASTAAARDELAQALPRLRELFTVSGLELGSASVHDGRGGGYARGGEHAHPGEAARDTALAALAGLAAEPSAGPRAVARGRIDVFA